MQDFVETGGEAKVDTTTSKKFIHSGGFELLHYFYGTYLLECCQTGYKHEYSFSMGGALGKNIEFRGSHDGLT